MALREPILAAEVSVDGSEEAGNPMKPAGASDQDLRACPSMASCRKEVDLQLNLGVPVACTYALDYLMLTMSFAFVGHLGTKELAAAALATSLANVTGFSVLEGLSSGMETLCGQAVGARNYKLLGAVAQRVHLILTVICIGIAVLWLNAREVLSLAGQDVQISHLAARYLLFEIPFLFSNAAFLPAVKMMQVQGVTAPLAYISSATLAFHFFANLACIYWLNLGFIGAPVAISISGFVQLGLLFAYLFWFDESGILERSWDGWSPSHALQGWGAYLGLAVPAAGMTCLEWWFFEIIILVSGWLPDPQVNVGAMTISLQTAGLCYMLPLAFATAASVRVGNELGAGQPAKARHAAVVSLLMSLGTGSALSCLLLLVRDKWPLVFADASQTKVLDLVSKTMPWLVLSQLLTGLAATLSGIVRGCGHLLAGSLLSGGSYYLAALPAALFFSLSSLDFGVQGLWLGIMLGLSLQVTTLGSLIAFTDWRKLVDKAAVLVASHSYDRLDSQADQEQLA